MLSGPARILAAMAAVAMVTAACGGAGAVGPSAATRVTVSAADSAWPPSPAGTWGVKPTVVVPTSPPPTRLVTEDLIVGTGAVAKPGDAVTVQYVGVSYTTKKQFDASWDRNQAFPFTLGIRQVIAGWDEGVVGMRVGGRRELIIPPSLAYGDKSPGPGIVKNDTLIFIVDLLQVG